jgi:peptide/nickel transport system permease protein
VLRYVVRRLVWALPTLFGASLVVFFLTTLLPEPAFEAPKSSAPDEVAAEREVALAKARYEARRRERFLDLPLFFNLRPNDVRTRSLAALERLDDSNAGDGEVVAVQAELERMGGACFPHVLTRLGRLSPRGKARVNAALLPVLDRIERRTVSLLEDQDAAFALTRFWDEHSIDFTSPAARRAVDRLLRYGTEEHVKQVRVLDSYVLPWLLEALERTERREPQVLALLPRVTGRVVSARDYAGELAEWQAFWFVHESDYVTYEGFDRVTESLLQTRYAKWTVGALTRRLPSPDGEPLSLARRYQMRIVPTSLLMIASILLAAFGAVPLGVVGARFRGRPVDLGLAFALLTLYSVPTFVLANAFVRLTSEASATRFLLAAFVLGSSALASLSRTQRAAILEVLSSDYIRSARARGVHGFGLLFRHALPNTIGPVVSLSGIQVPALLGAALVVEEIFGIPGMAHETIRAVGNHDASWIVLAVLSTAVLATFGLALADVISGLLDPRIADLLRKRGRS